MALISLLAPETTLEVRAELGVVPISWISLIFFHLGTGCSGSLAPAADMGLILNIPPDPMLNFLRVAFLHTLRGCRVGPTWPWDRSRVRVVTSRPIARIPSNVASDRSCVLFDVDIRVQRKILSRMDYLHP